jgi:hypothetical protein
LRNISLLLNLSGNTSCSINVTVGVDDYVQTIVGKTTTYRRTDRTTAARY